MASAILVTGGRGALGSALIARLRNDGLRVMSLDLAPGEHPDDLAGDLNDVKLMQHAMHQAAGVIHLAAVSGVAAGEADPVACLQINVVNSAGICQIASNMPQSPWLLFSSSVEVVRIKEGFNHAPNHIYGVSKYSAELVAGYYAAKHGLRVCCPRFSTLYGFTNQPPVKLLPRFIYNASQNQPIKILDADGLYNFLHVDDAIRGLLACANWLEQARAGTFEAFPLCGPETLSLAVLAERVKRLLASGSVIEAPQTAARVTASSDFTEANRLLGWRPEVDLDEGIRRLRALL